MSSFVMQRWVSLQHGSYGEWSEEECEHSPSRKNVADHSVDKLLEHPHCVIPTLDARARTAGYAASLILAVCL
jgi:hypothetical protein